MLKEIEGSGLNYEFWKTSNAINSSCLGIPGRERIDGADRSALTMAHMNGSLVLAGYLVRSICPKRANDEFTIASVARMHACMYVTVVIMNDERSV